MRLDDELPAYREMAVRLARDPAGQVIVFELMIQLFFQCVLGVRPECVGWRRGEPRRAGGRYCTYGCAAKEGRASAVGPVLAAFGPVEAQGRGSLHPHILVWLTLMGLGDLVERLLRDRSEMQLRLRRWMQGLVRAVQSVQHSSRQQLPELLGGSTETSQAEVPPLPFGPSEQRHYCADGERETATAE